MTTATTTGRKGVIFARPTYGASPDRAIDNAQLAAVMYASNHSVYWAGPACPDRTGWRIARNNVVAEAIERDDVSGILWSDDDVWPPVDAYYRLLADAATEGQGRLGPVRHLVSGLYFQRDAPYLPVVGSLNSKLDIDFWWDYPPNVIAPVIDGGFGFGCCFTSIEVLRAVSTAHPEGVFSGTLNGKVYGEDFLFCLRAGALGFTPYLDTGILCRHHLDSRYADEELFKRFRGEILPPIGGSAGGLKRVDPATEWDG